ncbi:beta-ketoacyl-ACP synthase III [Paenibacillus puerhi]|uniref:beta-ketoacyl-ACP synthase III n=1 Tax=Paenibacillus puerhi TaxID=2692622 RepID=UPI001358684E|nr:beta-ketoacyl-ACP synthase III [Paenibacillus puerhi]
MGVALTAIGTYLPERILTNDELAATVDTSDDWIRSRTGIEERRIAAPGETTSTLAVRAARSALERRGLAPERVELIVVATMMPDHPFPSTACLVQHELGATRAFAFDLSAACSGFVYALEVAAQFVKGGSVRNALVIGSEVISRYLDWEDRSTCVLFGDGAGAALLESADAELLLGGAFRSDGSGKELLYMPAGGTAQPATAHTVESRQHVLKMKGPELFQEVVPIVCETILDACERTGIALDDIRLIVPHQANVHIVEEIADSLNVPLERFYIHLQKVGNTSAASIPLALEEAVGQGRVEPGDYILIAGFGAGLTCGASIIRWGDSFRRIQAS